MGMEKPPDVDRFARELAPVLRASASIARFLEGRVANRPKRAEATAVKAALTAADTAVQEAILTPLLAHFPEVQVVAEEDTPTAQRFPRSAPAVVVVDPIDGTLRFYLEGLGPYAVLVGLAIDGEYAASLVALPREDLYFEAIAGGGARGGCAVDPPWEPLRCAPSGNRVLVSHDLPAPAVESLLDSGFEVAPASGGAIAVAPLIPGVRAGLRLALTGSVSIRGRIGALVATEAGARVACESGEPFPRALDAPARALLVAADEDDLAALLRAVALAHMRS
jgi:hypothetical protein